MKGVGLAHPLLKCSASAHSTLLCNLVVHLALQGQELGPLEIEINSLTKQIEEYNSEVMTLQKYWLRLQKELVKLTQEQEEQLVSLDMLKKEITIRQQKKVRIESKHSLDPPGRVHAMSGVCSQRPVNSL